MSHLGSSVFAAVSELCKYQALLVSFLDYCFKKKEMLGIKSCSHHLSCARLSWESVAELRWCFPAVLGFSYSLAICVCSPREE